MTDSSVDHKLGIVIGKLGGIEDRLEAQDTSRAKLHGRVDEVVQRIGRIESEQTAMKVSIASATEVTDEVRRWKLMGVGALAVTGMGAAAIGSFVTVYWSKFVAAITG